MCIIVQNLPVPFDRRVWLECQALTEAGYPVSVVCPKGEGDLAYEELSGVRIHRYRPFAPGGGAIGYIGEYLHSFIATSWLVLRAARRHRFRVLQACNPPDIFWPLGLIGRLFGVTYVFDHHDLCPELFRSRFPSAGGAFHRVLLQQERLTHRVAGHVIATNESYRSVAIERSGLPPERVTVVRTGPDLSRLQRVERDPLWLRGRDHMAAYIGVMGPQDGVDQIVLAADFLVNELGRDDISFIVMGGGDCFESLRADSARRGLQDHVYFTGRVPDSTVQTVLSTADVGLCPDLKNPLNDVSTMNKTMEYMAFGLPVVAYDLKETRVSAEAAAVYVHDGDVRGFAGAIAQLVDQPQRRQEMGEFGRRRVESTLAWEHQKALYLSVYAQLLGPRSPTITIPEQRSGVEQTASL